jgi:hypothetical protein
MSLLLAVSNENIMYKTNHRKLNRNKGTIIRKHLLFTDQTKEKRFHEKGLGNVI